MTFGRTLQQSNTESITTNLQQIHFSWRPDLLLTVANTGGSAGTRTQGHLIKSQMLYQLSYQPIRKNYLSLDYSFLSRSYITNISSTAGGTYTNSSTLIALCPL